MFSKLARVDRILSILCVMLLLVGCHKSANPFDGSQSTRIIVYCGEADGMCTYDVSSGEKKILANYQNGTYMAPACSPDGKRIAIDFSSDSLHNGQMRYTLNVMNSDGSNMKVLSTLLVGGGWILGGCSWSPNGSIIAFTKPSTPFNPLTMVLYVVNADGSGEHAVADSCIAVMGWNPWSGSILFFRTDPNLPAADLYSVNPDGSNLQKFMGIPLVQSVAWTADPNLVYVSILDSTRIRSTFPHEDAWLLGLGDKKVLRQITHGQSCKPLFVVAGGSELLCSVIDDTSDWRDPSLYIYDTSGTRLRKATNFKGEVNTRLSPSKDEIAFQCFNSSSLQIELHVASLDGTAQTLIGANKPGFQFDWLPWSM